MALSIFGEQAFEPTEIFLVGPGEGSQYPTITDAIIAAVQVSRTEENRAIIYISPSKYNEDLFVPDFVYLVGVGKGVHVAGSSDGTVPLVDVAQGTSIENMTIAPTLIDKVAGLVVRDATMLIGGIIGAPINGTLICSGDAAETQETFTFTGESTTAAVVALINATAINVVAEDRFGFVSIFSIENKLKIFSTGTANAALGYLTTDQIKERADNPTVYVTDVTVIGDSLFVSVPDQKKVTEGIVVEDRRLGRVIMNGIAVVAADGTASGIGFHQRRGTSVLANMTITGIIDGGSGGAGIKLSQDLSGASEGSIVQVLIGSGLFVGNGTDVVTETSTKVISLFISGGATTSGPGVFAANGNPESIASLMEWFLTSDVDESLSMAILTLQQYARRFFVPADDLYSPTVNGAVDAEINEQRVKNCATAVDRIVTHKIKHISTDMGQSKSGETLKCKVSCSIDVSGIALDVVRMTGEIIKITVGDDLAAPAPVTVSVDEDVSSIVADERFDVILDFTAAGAIADPDDLVMLKVFREGTHVNDTYGNTLSIWGFEYEV